MGLTHTSGRLLDPILGRNAEKGVLRDEGVDGSICTIAGYSTAGKKKPTHRTDQIPTS